jgi:hypothetical protein
VLGDGVPHLHVHLLPRFPGTPREYWGTHVNQWPQARRGPAADIEALVAQLRRHLLGDGPWALAGAAVLPRRTRVPGDTEANGSTRRPAPPGLPGGAAARRRAPARHGPLGRPPPAARPPTHGQRPARPLATRLIPLSGRTNRHKLGQELTKTRYKFSGPRPLTLITPDNSKKRVCAHSGERVTSG